MATIERFKTSDDYDPLHTLLNRPLIQIEALITALENRALTVEESDALSRIPIQAPIALEAPFSNGTDQSLTVRRGDNVGVSVSVRVTTASYLVGTSHRHVGTLPTGYRPSFTRFLTARAPSTGGVASAEIRTNGQIYMRGYSLATHNTTMLIEFSDTYPGLGDYIGA